MAGRACPVLTPLGLSGAHLQRATNKPPIVPYRGVARTGICFAIELTIDAVARAVGREPCDVRHENLAPATAMPFRA